MSHGKDYHELPPGPVPRWGQNVQQGHGLIVQMPG